MLTLQLITTNYPFLKDTDTAAFALQLMEQNHTEHLPIVNDGKYLGLVAKEDLSQIADNDIIDAVVSKWLHISLQPQDHLFPALRTMLMHDLSLIGVTNAQGEWLGALTRSSLMQACGKFLGVEQPGGIITFATDKKNLSLSEIARLVETNDAYITQLNTQTDYETGLIEVCIKVNKTEVATIVATLQRYDYIIKNYTGEENFENELKENYDSLMAYLNI